MEAQQKLMQEQFKHSQDSIKKSQAQQNPDTKK
jgi:hypothetical protein